MHRKTLIFKGKFRESLMLRYVQNCLSVILSIELSKFKFKQYYQTSYLSFKSISQFSLINNLLQMNKCQQEVQKNNETVIWNSGKFVTQLGLFQDCLSFPIQKYGLLQMFNKTTQKPLGIMMGVCFPQICSKAQIQTIANVVLEGASLELTTSYVQSPENYDPGIKWTLYLTTTIIAILLVLLFLATLFSKKLKKMKLIQSFNCKNSLKIFQYKESNLNIFNGIKTLCMMWVIFGHLYSIRLQNAVNVLTLQKQVESTFFLFVLSAFFAVDVFFYIGGFLVAYSFLRNSMKSVLKYPLAILHRLLRFWPSYIMAILIYYSLFLHSGEGPLWWTVEKAGQVENCSSIWKPLIFVDNLVDNGQQMCLGWGWYLQNDMQIFIFSIPILYLYNKKRSFALLTILVLMIGSFVANFTIVQVQQYITVAHRIDFLKWNSYFPNVYIKPWIRCPPYLYGLFLGLLYMEFLAAKKHNSQAQTFFGKVKVALEKNENLKNGIQIIGLLLLLFVIFIPRTLQVHYYWPQVVHSLYLTFGKIIFVIGVSLIATPSLLGIKNDLALFLLDTKLFNFTSKISFWTYLIHYMLILLVCYSQKVDFYYNILDVLSLYLGVVVMSMICGFLGTMIVEVPFAKIQKMLFEKKSQKDKGKKEEVNKTSQNINETIVEAMKSEQET